MKTLQDCFGRQVRLTDERLAHILEHAEMAGLAAEIEQVLREPQLVRRARADEAVRLYYEFTRKRLWVANGCAWRFNAGRAMRLASPPI
jgi:hypothetical protein